MALFFTKQTNAYFLFNLPIQLSDSWANMTVRCGASFEFACKIEMAANLQSLESRHAPRDE